MNINITEPIYLTLTTIPERFVSEHFRKVYESLNSQYISYTFLIINLSIDEFSYTIPQYLIDDQKVIIHKTNICGPCTKLIGSLDIIPVGSIVIVLDDDIIMRKNFISSLYYSYIEDTNCVWSSITKEYKKFTEVQGFGGFIFKMTDKILGLKLYYYTMPSCAKYIDDTWVGWCFYKLGITVRKALHHDPWNTVLDIKETDTHPVWYELNKCTDRYNLTREFLEYCDNYETKMIEKEKEQK